MNFLFTKSAIRNALHREQQEKSHTILLVDDEIHNLNTLSDLLVDDYHILTANNGDEALALLQDDAHRNNVHLIISDQRMPKMNGVDFLKKTLDIVPHTKRIILTGYTDVEAIIDSINEAQIYKFITKPFDPMDMQLTVNLALKAYDLEQQNKELLEELQTLNRSLEEKVTQRTQALRELNAAKDRFFSIIAHDLRNPLNHFVLSTDMLVESSDALTNPLIQRLAGSLQGSALKLRRMLQNLQDWSSLQMGQMRCHPKRQPIAPLIHEALELLHEQIQQKELDVSVQLQTDKESDIDYNFVSTILRNLLSNAIKFTPPQGDITVTASFVEEDGQEYLTLSVQDTGAGISPKDLAKLFRIDTKHTTRGTNGETGTGLGLTLCKSLAEEHSGELSVESREGEGSRFALRIPCNAQEVLTHRNALAPSTTGTSASAIDRIPSPDQ